VPFVANVDKNVRTVNWGRREIRAVFTMESSLKTFFWKAKKAMEG
jgi:hypothetical protein